jgi:predicted nucleic acid-binding protein
MIAVSNTTLLRYLIAIDQADLLGKLFEKVFIPAAVYEELTETKTPESVRRYVLSSPVWLGVSTVGEIPANAFPVSLHRGEREAILLAETMRCDVLLIDEQIGRAIALSRKLPLSGTLRVLERADMMGLVPNFLEALKQLKTSGFFIAESLEQQLLRRHRARRGVK